MCKHKSGGMSKPTASQGALAEGTPSGANCPQSEPRSSDSEDSDAEQAPMLPHGEPPCQLQNPLQTPASYVPQPHGYGANPGYDSAPCQLQMPQLHGYAARWVPRPETAESDAELSPMLHPGCNAAPCQLLTPHMPQLHGYAARWVPRPETANPQLYYGEASCHAPLPHGYAAGWVPHQTGIGDSPYADKMLNPNHRYQVLQSSVIPSNTSKPQGPDGSSSYYYSAARWSGLDHAPDKTPDQNPNSDLVQLPDSGPDRSSSLDPNMREPVAELSVSSSVANVGDSSPTCKICHAAARDGDPLISPCRCSGTMRYIHCSCLMTWLEVCYKRGRRPMSCELCQYQYHWHKKFQVRHLRLPRCSRRDKALHLLFLVSVVLMVSCASVTALCFRSETRLHAKDHAKVAADEAQRPLSAAELATVASGVLFFVAFFAAMLAEIRARDTLCRLLARFVRLNQQWYIDEYRKPVPV